MECKYEQLVLKPVQNVNGQYMTFQINKFQCGYEVNIVKDWWHLFQIKILVLIVLIIVGFIDYQLNIFYCYHCILVVILFITILYQIHGILKSEKLLVVKHVGWQIEENCLLGSRRTFIPWHLIDSIFINEVIHMQRILFILTLKTKDKDNIQKLFPLFEMTKPRLSELKEIYQVLQHF